MTEHKVALHACFAFGCLDERQYHRFVARCLLQSPLVRRVRHRQVQGRTSSARRPGRSRLTGSRLAAALQHCSARTRKPWPAALLCKVVAASIPRNASCMIYFQAPKNAVVPHVLLCETTFLFNSASGFCLSAVKSASDCMRQQSLKCCLMCSPASGQGHIQRASIIQRQL